MLGMKEEKRFDINAVLRNVYMNLMPVMKERGNMLVYFMEKSLPRFFRGEAFVYEQLLTDLFEGLFSLFEKSEVLLNISAPETFIFEEDVRFEIVNIPPVSRTALEALCDVMEESVEAANGRITLDEKMNVVLTLPMKIAETGERRFYRLPSSSLLGKRILLLMQSGTVLMSIARMFKYFPFDVDIGINGYQPDRHPLEKYDLILLEKKFADKTLLHDLAEVQEYHPIKCVLFGERDILQLCNSSTYLDLPITQGTVFELIVELFTNDDKPAVTRGSEQKERFEEEMTRLKEEYETVLDTMHGKENAQRIGRNYSEILERFLEEYGDSDLYFRDIVLKEKYEDMMEFVHNLKMSASMIGAHDLLVWIKMFETVWRYKRYELLPTYPGKYHIELEKLKAEIERYLYGKARRVL